MAIGMPRVTNEVDAWKPLYAWQVWDAAGVRRGQAATFPAAVEFL